MDQQPLDWGLVANMRDRIPADALDDIVEYIEFSEAQLALELLADSLGEEGASITTAELYEFESLALAWRIEDNRFDFLRSQVR